MRLARQITPCGDASCSVMQISVTTFVAISAGPCNNCGVLPKRMKTKTDKHLRNICTPCRNKKYAANNRKPKPHDGPQTWPFELEVPDLPEVSTSGSHLFLWHRTSPAYHLCGSSCRLHMGAKQGWADVLAVDGLGVCSRRLCYIAGQGRKENIIG
jgi:hypothetical protein